jgi:hypothetical protein
MASACQAIQRDHLHGITFMELGASQGRICSGDGEGIRGAHTDLGDCQPNRKAPRGGRLCTGCGGYLLTRVLPVGCLWFTDDLSWAWQGRKGDHV